MTERIALQLYTLREQAAAEVTEAAQDGWLGFRKDCQYREKHSTFKVNGFVIPEPETNEPDANTIFYTPDIIAT